MTLALRKLDEEKLSEKDYERARKVCKALVTDEQRAEFGASRIAEQKEIIGELEEENKVLRMQIEGYNSLERECRNMQRRCIELESENLMLEKRLSLLTNEGVDAVPEDVIMQANEHNGPEDFSDDDLDGIEDAGLKRAIRENQEKMAALRKEIRSLIVGSNPGTTELRTKKAKQVKDGGYDYSEEIN